MKLSRKVELIALNAVPIVVMILLIPLVLNDYLLAVSYLVIIGVSFWIKHVKRDWLFFLFGLVVMTVSEYFFVMTGVETFHRRSLLGVMPIWLPILWAYGFIAMKRSIVILRRR